MFNQHNQLILNNEEPTKNWWLYIWRTATVATLSALGHELAKWAVDELRIEYGTPAAKETTTKETITIKEEDKS